MCPKVWMWSHPSFSSYCSYSHRLCKLDNIVFAMLDPINDLWKQLSTLVGANITATGLSYCHLYCTRSFFFWSEYVTSTVSAGTNQNFCCFIQPNFDFVFHVEVWQPTCVWRGSINHSGCANNHGISIETAPHVLQFLSQFLPCLGIKSCP